MLYFRLFKHLTSPSELNGQGQPGSWSAPQPLFPSYLGSTGSSEGSGGGGWRRARRAAFVSYPLRALLTRIACPPGILTDLSIAKPQGHFSKPGFLPRPSSLPFSRAPWFYFPLSKAPPSTVSPGATPQSVHIYGMGMFICISPAAKDLFQF